ncbi:phage tail protein [Achromobacter ruhlandii]|uniref:phage tail protein n=1 Tax=Achromobacter ruhlandii TaxID=72557 RepID=UPI000C2590C0|nr:phage tail protein [Achromobacter ruhlandii]PJM72119.1 phage tail protein [Achromobacter ruhlandii]
MQKAVFQTDSDGLFQYETVANELPLSPGMFNVPYGAQETAPPAAPAGMVARWDGERWGLVEDYRQAALYVAETGAPYILGGRLEIAGEPVSYSGWGPLPAWLTTVAPSLPTPV